jgi:predicted regulator of Ras-like GTPase activity (Roadblock/LC7/MglB family)
MIGHFAPARAMAIGGGVTDRYSNDDVSPIQGAIEDLAEKVSGVALMIDRHGMLVAAAGDAEFDTTALANSVARDFLGSQATAQLLSEQGFSTQYIEEGRANVHVQLVGRRLVLVVLFDARTSLGMVRLRVKKAIEAMVGDGPGALRAFEAITGEDIDALFFDPPEPDDEDN